MDTTSSSSHISGSSSSESSHISGPSSSETESYEVVKGKAPAHKARRDQPGHDVENPPPTVKNREAKAGDALPPRPAHAGPAKAENLELNKLENVPALMACLSVGLLTGLCVGGVLYRDDAYRMGPVMGYGLATAVGLYAAARLGYAIVRCQMNRMAAAVSATGAN
ncbi:MAG: hypothetical protein JWP36_2043 [Paucimonas sp.]|nr:hypothetical protein [Paucimonas sp.]